MVFTSKCPVTGARHVLMSTAVPRNVAWMHDKRLEPLHLDYAPASWRTFKAAEGTL